MEDQFTKTKQDLANSLKKLLSADAGLAGDNPVTRGYLNVGITLAMVR